MTATTIDEIISRLEAILADCIKNNDRLGFFAALYYKVTCNVKQGILNNEFEDGKRMERLDVVFASRYLDAYDQWKSGTQPSASWKIAFETSKRSSPLVLQHLVLGINAHINLDLGIAAVEVAGEDDLKTLKNDFNAINNVLASMTAQVINDINKISPLLSLLGLHANNYNSMFIQFAISNARDGAWSFAESLSANKGLVKDVLMNDRDRQIQQLGTGMTQANFLLKVTLTIIHLFEKKKPSTVINALLNDKKTYFKIK